MTRPGDAEWSVLQVDSDPVPGDPESFDEITRAYQELSRTTREAHDLLASGGQVQLGQGKAMEAFRDLIGKLPGRLDRMANSYAAAADAYLRYLPSLEEAQAMSLRALDQARQASGDQVAAQAALALAQATVTALGADPAADQAAKDRASDDDAAAQSRASDAQQALDQAKALLGQATALRDQAARTAAQTLRGLAKDAPQRSLWEKIVEAFQAFIDFLRSTVVQWITAILDALSVIASFIFPPLGQAIGFLSGAIDLAAAAVSGDPAAIGLAAGGLVLGLVPGGRLVSRIVKAAGSVGNKLPGTVSDGIRNSIKGLGGSPGGASARNVGKAPTPGAGIDTTVTTLGLGKTIKGVFTSIGNKIEDLRFARDLRISNERRANDPRLLAGMDQKGRLRTFSIDDVQSVPLKDSNGRQIGVIFPSRSTDVANFTDWGAQKANLAAGKNLGGSMDVGGLKIIRQLPGKEPTLVGNEFLAAPWSRLKSDPMFIFAHGSPDSAAVTLTNGRVVNVPGASMAKILNEDPNFRALAEANPKAAIAMISCNFGNSAGDAGQQFADVMRDLGNKRPIFAANNTVHATQGQDLDGLFTNPGETIATLAVESTNDENDGKGEFRKITPTPRGRA
ncbi:hypothetical protein ACN28C_08000 [Plantactinospora sp. WMMC1484]|uniref:hypothetical protein n=1 Tax=Plantactinospora sp. WMMC1484 TaxID=3404122 RepID=UPI003BF48351